MEVPTTAGRLLQVKMGARFRDPAGTVRIVRRGMIVREGHPAFKGREHLLTDPKVDYDFDWEGRVEKAEAEVQAKTIDEVLAEVGDDQGRAAAALLAERKSKSPRKTLVEKLDALAREGE